MNLLAPQRVRIQKEAVVRIIRSLKAPGRIIVAPNQEVSPAEIIGTAFVSAGFRTINLAGLLGVAPPDIGKYLKRPVGQKIYKGELLAYKSSFFGGKKNIISPTDGVLDYLDLKTGEARLKFLPKKQDLPAGVYGIVEAVDSQKGRVVIRAEASLIFGMFGSGRVKDGILHILTARDEFLEKRSVAPGLGDHILVDGSLLFRDVITSAISAGVSGIITGGINARDYRSMSGNRLVFPKRSENDVGVSIVVCEGFGSVPIGEDIYELLKSFNDRFVSVDGNKAIICLPSFQSQSMTKVRSTGLPPMQESELLSYSGGESGLADIKQGLFVRVIGNSYQGDQGRVLAVDRTETLMPSGIKTFMAAIETKRSRFKIPVANLEIIL